MANITLVPPIMLASHLAPFRITCVAGVAIAAGEPCYIDANGQAQLSVATASPGSNFDGVPVKAAVAGEAITLFQQGAKITVGAHGQAIGSFWYISDTAGLFSTVSIPTAPELPVAKAISTTVIEITRMDRPAT